MALFRRCHGASRRREGVAETSRTTSAARQCPRVCAGRSTPRDFVQIFAVYQHAPACARQYSSPRVLSTLPPRGALTYGEDSANVVCDARCSDRGWRDGRSGRLDPGKTGLLCKCFFPDDRQTPISHTLRRANNRSFPQARRSSALTKGAPQGAARRHDVCG